MSAATPGRPFLFDATRLVWRRLVNRLPTGIERVCQAYLEQFAERSHAVVQYRGAVRVLTARHSDALFDLLRDPIADVRRRIALLAPGALAAGRSDPGSEGAVYLNVGHTDFDLPAHARWARRCRLRPVYMIHDLIPLSHPELSRPKAVARHRARVRAALRGAAGIVVTSRSAAAELAGFARRERLSAPPVLAIPLGTPPLAAPRAGFPALPAVPYFACVGTIERRKNHLLLLRVWQRLVARSGIRAPHLVLIGQPSVGASEVAAVLHADAALRAHVHLVPRCPDTALAGWIAGAEALLMPTLAEGFGLPMAEAFALGTPVIASDLPCFREFGAGIPTLLDPRDAAAWEGAISRFGADGDRARQRAALAGYRPPTWELHFASLEPWLEVLSEPLAMRSAPGGAVTGRHPDGPLARTPAFGVAED